jgi:beta-glucanase (GH16 family)
VPTGRKLLCVVCGLLALATPLGVEVAGATSHEKSRARNTHHGRHRVSRKRKRSRRRGVSRVATGAPASAQPGGVLAPASPGGVVTGASPSAPTGAMPSSPTGEAPASVPTPARHLVWSEAFAGPAGTSPDPTKWSFDTGGNGWGNNELQYYTSRPSNAALDGHGDLVITARRETYKGPDGVTRGYTSARLQTLDKFEFTYGLLEARIQVPTGQGLLPGFWTLGSDAYASETAWPGCGETDVMEVLGSEPNVLNGTVHGPWPSLPNGVGGTDVSPTPLSAGFHVYGVEWAPDRISFLLDGSVYKTVTPSDLPSGSAWPFNRPEFLLLNLAVGGDWPGSPSASTTFPAQLRVNWVRVWQ